MCIRDSPTPPQALSWNIGDVEPWIWFDPGLAVYLDGSGGRDSKDRRLRRVGWSWCQVYPIPADEVRPGLDSDDIGQYGTMEGVQSVPRSELYALMSFVMYTVLIPEPCEVDIYSDNQAVVEGFHKGPTAVAHSNMDDLWETFWALHDTATTHKWKFRVHKIKSHTLEKDFNEHPIDLDEMPMQHRIGNSRADRWADAAAEIVQCDDGIRRNVSFADAQAWIIRRRLLCICQNFLLKHKKEEDSAPKRHRINRVAILNEKGHQAEIRESRIVCQICASNWPRNGRADLYRSAELCPGVPPVLTDLFPGHARVAQRLFASGLHIGGVKIDPSHTLAHINGITFCTKCGNYAIKVVKDLARGCQMKVSNPTKARNLRRLLQGRLPTGMKWPSPGAAVPDYIRPYIADSRAMY